MPQDLRSFLELLRQTNDLAYIDKDVDPVHEIAAVMKRSAEQDGPALIFRNVRGSTIPLAANVLASKRRVAIALGAPNIDSIIANYQQRMADARAPVRVEGSGQPCSIDSLSDLPIITINEFDAGAYITSGIIFASHPDTKKLNLSFQRMCPISKNEVAAYVGPHGDLAAYGRAAKGQPLPVAVAIGMHPAFMLVAATRFSPDMHEIELVGGLLGESVRLTQGASGEWLIPEAAEIVLEGEIDFARTVLEGPFGEYPGYYGGGTLEPKPAPVIRFHSMRCKTDPICQTLITGPTTGYESTNFSPLSKEAMLFAKLSAKYPQLRRISLGLSRYIGVVQIDGDMSDDDAKSLMGDVFANSVFVKYVILTDDDVDAANPLDVLWGLSTRVDPGRHMHIFHDMPMETLDPSTNQRCDKVAFDARKPVGSNESFVRTRIPGFEDIKLEDYLPR
jgi:2,5-furandicarboxylate decarboxylase 1